MKYHQMLSVSGIIALIVILMITNGVKADGSRPTSCYADSQFDANSPASAACDWVVNSRWESMNFYPHWIVTNFTSNVTITDVAVLWPFFGEIPSQVSFQRSIDGVNW